MALTAKQRDINDIEMSIAARRYDKTVKVKADGSTSVTLKHRTDGHVFEGAASRTASDGYAVALNIAFKRMVAYEDRFA